MAKLLKLKTKKKNQNEDEMNFDEFNEEDKSKKIGVDSLIDSEAFSEIVPFSFEEKLDYIITGDKYVRSLPIIDYPKEKHGNWLSELRRKKGEISIVQYIESSPAKKCKIITIELSRIKKQNC